jgi:hypothetical protein
MEAVSTTETSVTSYHTTRRNIPEDSHLQELLNSWKEKKFKLIPMPRKERQG